MFYRYPIHLSFTSPSEMAYFSEEFTSFQLLEKEDIPERVWESAVVVEKDGSEGHFRMDIIWSHLNQSRSSDGNLLFGRVCMVN